MRVFVINPGATSTKIAVFEEENEVFRRDIRHDGEALSSFKRITDQLPFRKELIDGALREAGYRPADFDAVCARGGLLRHVPSGTYEVNERALGDLRNPPRGEHASNLGLFLAKAYADEAGVKAYFVDPVSVDEMTDVARISGFAGIERESFFHALNQKRVARLAAGRLGRRYEELNLIVAHMGGGVSVAAHEKGRVIDVFNANDDGAFSMDRAGGLPSGALIDFCFSGRSKEEVKRIFRTRAGVFSYLGTRDGREVEKRADAGDRQAALIYDALVYQYCKDIGAMAAALSFQVDAVLLTGGMAYSEKLCGKIVSRVERLAPVLIFPGEEEMRSLAEGALRVLRGEPAKSY